MSAASTSTHHGRAVDGRGYIDVTANPSQFDDAESSSSPSSGSSVEEKIDEHLSHLVLTDGMADYDLLEQIRTRNRYQDEQGSSQVEDWDVEDEDWELANGGWSAFVTIAHPRFY